MVSQDDEKYLSLKETCALLGISRQALDGYVKRGELTKYQRPLSRRVFFKYSEVVRLLEIHKK